jgi:dTDP-4-dehydrorhamnose reductase
MARNAGATEALAIACEARRVSLVLVSTNEVFDGARADGRGYTESDGVAPINAYGRSKLAAEEAARSVFGRYGPPLWIVRTSWLFGPPGNDFPTKIVAAADRLDDGQALRVADDEFGSPTFSEDLAQALVALPVATPPDVYHLVPAGAASRFDVAQTIIDRCRPGTPMERISRRDFSRASEPPGWGVLDPARASGYGIGLRDWRAAIAEYLDQTCGAYDRDASLQDRGMAG